MKKTEWYKGNQKPVRKGVYERKMPWGPHTPFGLAVNGLTHLVACGSQPIAIKKVYLPSRTLSDGVVW